MASMDSHARGCAQVAGTTPIMVASPAWVESECVGSMTTNCARVLALSCPTREPAATPPSLL